MHELNSVWQTNITYIQLTNHRWVYLATVFDPEKKKVLGYKIEDSMTAELATSALQMALDKCQKPLIVHEDMGSQYTSTEFNIKCQNYGLKHLYSLKGHPYDNARMEAFHSILKREDIYLKAYLTLTEVQAGIGWYVNSYNSNRISNVA
ncbi:transposase [Leuconostoc citreum]